MMIGHERWPPSPLHLPPALLTEALAARDIRDDDDRARALATLAPHLPPALLTEALAAARQIDSEWHRSRALAALTYHLPPELLAEALAAACAIAREIWRSTALAALAPRLAALPALDGEFAPTLRILNGYGRIELLHDLRALQPWLMALAQRHDPALPSMLATAIIEAGRCWP